MKSFTPNREEFKKIPQTTGLYYFYDENDEILYIGRAKILRTRIASHLWNYYIHKEGMFLRKITLSKGYDFGGKEEFPKELKEAWSDFKDRAETCMNMIVFDKIFDRTKRIEIEEIPEELYKSKEKKMIQKFKPPFNFETRSDEYDEINELI